MITTNSFPNIVTSSPKEEDSSINKNSLTKEDLEGKIKKNINNISNNNINGGTCQNIEI